MAARQRKRKDAQSSKVTSKTPYRADETSAMVDEERSASMTSFYRRQPVWVILAISSGACAAINGVFAKLTTTSLTGTLADNIARFLGLAVPNTVVNLVLRGTFFGLNLLFNAIMWALFTAALTKGSSTTRVSIINVSANFFITAMLGWMIFGENLPLQWWMGAGLLAAGNVVIGRREEGEKKVDDLVQEASGEDERLMGEERQEDLMELDEPLSGSITIDGASRLKRGEEIDDPV